MGFLRWRMVMAKVGKDQDFDSFFSKVGPDATSTFDNSTGDESTEFANSEATNAATAVVGKDAALEEEDDDAAELEEDDEENEEEDVEDEAGSSMAAILRCMSLARNGRRFCDDY
jgi:hypothetical protein